MSSKKPKCEYGECRLPKNNKKYLCQFCYMTMAILALAVSRAQITALAILLFVLPVLFDFIFNLDDIEYLWYKHFCKIGIITNSMVALFCFGVFTGAIVDVGDAFINAPASVLPSIYLQKDYVLLFCISDLIGPIAFWQGCTSQETLQKVTL